MELVARIALLYQLISDFLKKCNEDHVTAFGTMSAFFILLSTFPFLIFFLTLTQFAPFSKEDIINVLVNILSFESRSLITSVVNEIYKKTSTSVFTFSIITTLWSSSKGFYSILKGLDSVYDLEDRRNYFVLRFLCMIYTVIFSVVILALLILWLFGNTLYDTIRTCYPTFTSVVGDLINMRAIVTIVILTVCFMIIYKFVPDRPSSFFRQWPGALVAALGWIVVSLFCSLCMEGFTSFSYVYGSMAGIMILLLWLYFCMSLVFYGAEFNYFLENKKNYHKLVLLLRHNRRASQRKRAFLRNSKKEEKGKEKETSGKESEDSREGKEKKDVHSK